MSERSESLGSVEFRSAAHILHCSLIVISKGNTYKQYFLYPRDCEAVLY